MQLPHTLTLSVAGAALGELNAEFARNGSGTLRIDAGPLVEFDTAALALLLEAQRRARAAGRNLEIDGAPPKLQQLARLYGVHELLGLRA
jgi:phospholipid transport system transporter-binding protein